MSTVRRITKNTVLLNMARVISTLGKFFLFIYIARVLGQEILGQFSFAVIFTSFFAIIISLGMDDLLVREVARDTSTSKKYLGNMLMMRFLLSLLVMGAIVITINVIGYPPDTRLAVYIFGMYIVFTSFSFLFRANFRAFEKMEWDALLEILEAITTTAVGIIVIFSGFGLIALSLTYLTSAIINAAIGYFLNRRKFSRFMLEFDFYFWKTIIKKSAPFSVFALFILYPQVDTILLSNLKGDAIVGKYNAAYYVVTAFSPIVMNFMIALVPLISRYFISAKTMLSFVYEKSIKYLLLIAFPISVGAVVLSNKLTTFLYGSGYEDTAVALQILAWNCVLLAMSRPMFYVLGAINRQGTCAVITVSALTLSICLNLFLIPRWGYLGSAAITLLNGVLVTVAAWFSTRKYGFPVPLLKVFWRPAIASIIMGTILYLTDFFTTFNLFILIFLGITTYLISIIVIKSFTKDDWSLLKEAISGRARRENTDRLNRDSAKQLSEVKN